MRVMRWSAVVLLAIGVWISIHPPSYSREESVLRIGNIEASVRREQVVPAWVGGAAIGAGVVVILLALVRR